MKFSQWLKKIYLLPFCIFMGIEGEAATIQDAGADTQTQTAEAVSNPGEETSGADTQTATAEQQASQADETTNTEGAEGATEGSTSPDKGVHQTTLEERVQQLAEKRISEVEAKLNAKFEEVTRAKEEAKPNFYEIDIAVVNDHIREIMDKIEELRLDGNFLAAMDLQDDLNLLRRELKANEQRKAEYIKNTQEQQQTKQVRQQINIQLTQATELVAKESGMPPEVWKAGEDFFAKERAAKPLVDAQYREKVYTQGPVAAILWAKEYVEKNMGKKEQEVINQKQTAKNTLPPGKTSTGEVAGGANLAALKAKAASGNAEDLAKYMAEKSKAAAT